MAGRGRAEEYMRAVARDLVEEIAAARALELAAESAADGDYFLAAYQVRAFPRTETTPQGKVIPEHVKEHWVQGEPGHEIPNVSNPEWSGGQQEWTARGRALAAAHERVGVTQRNVAGSALPGQRTVKSLGDARQALAEQKLPDAYKHLATAHSAGVEDMLSRAQTPEAKDEVRGHLDAIQGHMEHLDKTAGLNPNRTRRVVGSTGQQNERAGMVRDQAKADLRKGYGSQQGEAKVHAAYHEGLLSDSEHKSMADEASQAYAATQQQQQAAEVQRLKGAAAVYPQVGQGARTVMPGGTFSGHESMNRAMPGPMLAAAPPEAAELARANQRIEGYANREAQRSKQDLGDHVAEMRAAEAERRGQAKPGEYAPLTDDQFAGHQQYVSHQVEKALRKGQDTVSLHTVGHQGQLWTSERLAQQDEILKDYLDKQTDVPSQRQALFEGGLIGAGKSTLMENHPGINVKDYAPLSADYFKEELMKRGMAPEVEGLSPMETASLVHEESLDLTNAALDELLARGKNIAWETTMMRAGASADRVRQLKEAGYKVHGVLADIPVEQSAQRADSRYRQQLEGYRKGTNPLGGRYIPRSDILYGEAAPGVSRASQNFDKLKPQFDSWEHHDTSVSPPRLVAKSDAAPQHDQPIPSVEALRRVTGSTEQQARAAETGQQAKQVSEL